MIKPVDQFFSQFLTLMEPAFEQLSGSEFRELEDKITHEIYDSRANPSAKRKEKESA